MTVFNEANIELEVPDFVKITSKNEVFYNPIMSFNRDISLLNLWMLPNDLSILCGMAGTGVRAIRYAKSGFNKVTANDINPKAYDLIIRNAELNKVNLRATCMDFNLIEDRYDLIDIDPFGSPVRYLHPSFRLFGRSGNLFVTATDTAALCGSSKRACIRKYSAYPMKTSYCHEVGLRLLLGYMVRQAASWNFGAYPKLCFYKDHYMRAHIALEKGKRKADGSMESLGFLHHCDKCKNRFFSKSPVCTCDCGAKLRIAHPVWGGNLFDNALVETMIENIGNVPLHDPGAVRDFLGVVKNEVESPFYWDSHDIFSYLKIHVPPMSKILEMIKEAGYSASRTHFNPMGFKTDADYRALIQIFSK